VSERVEANEHDPCVLLVEDHDLLRVVRERQLREECFRVLIARDGESALPMLDEHRVDVVAADYYLPGMDGVTLLELVRSRHPHVGRVLCSGFPPPEVERWAYDNEVPLIIKGSHPAEELVLALREQCAKRARRDTSDGDHGA
jgi:CheY-like chemotaxis protein